MLRLRAPRTWLLLLLLVPLSAVGQEWTTKLQEGSELLRQRRLDEAQAIFEGVRDQAVKDGTGLAEAGARMGLGSVRRDRAEYAAALRDFERAAELYERNPGPIANRWRVAAYEQISTTAYYLGEHAKALDAAGNRLQLARTSGNPTMLGKALYSIAFHEATTQKSLEYLREGLDAATAAKDTATLAMIHHLWSDRLWLAGQYSEAQQRLTTALSLLDRPGLETERARALTSQGRLHRTYSRYSEALASYAEALGIQERMGDRPGARQSLEAMALALDRLGRSAEAAAHLERALSVARSIGAPSQVASVLEQMGTHLHALNEDARAIPMYEESVRLDPTSAQAWGGAAYSYLKENRPADALESAGRALKLPMSAATHETALLARAGALHRLGRQSEVEQDVRAALEEMEQERRHLLQDDSAPP